MRKKILSPIAKALRAQGGIYKRIDEIRELNDLLSEADPKFIDEHRWVQGWLLSTDQFLCGLEEAVKTIDPDLEYGYRLYSTPWKPYPRPWRDHRQQRDDKKESTGIDDATVSTET